MERLGQGLWWAAVTITTVGYGDVVPQTLGGRLVGVSLMVSGLVIISLLTATLASVFVERKLQRIRGLENIRAANHIIILGWHRGGEQIIQNLAHRLDRQTSLVLVNTLDPEVFEPLKDKFPDLQMHFVRGDYAREEILAKANLARARKVVLLADRMENLSREEVDQRTLLTALAVKAVNPQVKICAELLNPDNRPHLERARVEDIVVRGEYDSALIASATESAGMYKVLRGLLSPEAPNFWAVEIPARFHNKPLKDFSTHLRNQYQALLIALFSEGQKLRLEDLLSTERSAIDDFIYRKFTEAGKTHLFGGHKVSFIVNPPDDHVIAPHEMAVVIASEPPPLSAR
jgi:voltage-gated potassium channel